MTQAGLHIEVTGGLSDWEILQQENGYASTTVFGIISSDEKDDTEQQLFFSPQSMHVRIVNEADGSFVTPLLPVEVQDNAWHVLLKDIPCGGPYYLDVLMLHREQGILYPLRGKKIRHFCVGDIYLIAGQSNAAGMGKGIAAETPEMGIHVLRDLKRWDIATQPFCDSDYAKESMFLAFAKMVKKQTGYPIGLVPAAMGGAGLSRWLLSEEGDLYRKALQAVKFFCSGIRAVLWYQGCTDAGQCRETEEYLRRFCRFAADLRRDLNRNLPIFTFQLNRQKLRQPNERLDLGYSQIREAQRRVPQAVEGVYVLPAIDAVQMSDFIHSSSSSNHMLGQRLACQVLNILYHKGLGIHPPEIVRAVCKGGLLLEMTFKNVDSFLYGFNCNMLPFQIEDAHGPLKFATGTVSGSKITLSMDRPCVFPAYVSGQHGADPLHYLIDFDTQLPMLCFHKFPIEKE